MKLDEMMAVSATAEKVFRAAIALMHEQTSRENEQSTTTHIRIGEPGKPVMQLVVEFLHNLDGHARYSFAHYYTQNGDAMRDPEICMIDQGPGRLLPYYYRQDGLGIENDYYSVTGNMCWSSQEDLARFCGSWARNLVAQQPLLNERMKAMDSEENHA